MEVKNTALFKRLTVDAKEKELSLIGEKVTKEAQIVEDKIFDLNQSIVHVKHELAKIEKEESRQIEKSQKIIHTSDSLNDYTLKLQNATRIESNIQEDKKYFLEALAKLELELQFVQEFQKVNFE